MDEKTLNKVLEAGFAKQDARFEANLTKALAEQDSRSDARFEAKLTKALETGFEKQDARFEAKLNNTIAKALTKFEKRIDARFDRQDARFDSKLTTALAEQARDYRDFTRQEIKASENRLMNRMDDSESRILLAVAETHDAFILPRIHNVEKRLLKLEAKVA